jgi:short-subunit dehydrogenase
MMDDSFSKRYGPWALVAGAARGIGREFCRELLARGIHVLALDKDADALTQAFPQSGPDADPDAARVRTAAIDLAATDVVQQVSDFIGSAEVGLFVHTAAAIPFGPFSNETPAALEAAVSVNCRAPILLSHELLAPMRERGRGGAIIVSSMAGYQGNGWVAAYAATKAFDLVLAESLWWEMKQHGVDVLGLAPGATDTEGLRSGNPTIDDPSSLASPRDVAIEGLDALGTTPSLICGKDNRAVREMMDQMPRADAIDLMSRGTKAMSGG